MICLNMNWPPLNIKRGLKELYFRYFLFSHYIILGLHLCLIIVDDNLIIGIFTCIIVVLCFSYTVNIKLRIRPKSQIGAKAKYFW